MTDFPSNTDRDRKFEVRPAVLLVCFGVLLTILLPDAIRGHRNAKWLLLIFGTFGTILGWFFYLRDRDHNSRWRDVFFVCSALCLTASLPTFFFEMSPFKWFLRGHKWPSLYVIPWVHWWPIFIFLPILGSLLGRGRARVAFTVVGILLLILWASMPTWVF